MSLENNIDLEQSFTQNPMSVDELNNMVEQPLAIDENKFELQQMQQQQMQPQQMQQQQMQQQQMQQQQMQQQQMQQQQMQYQQMQHQQMQQQQMQQQQIQQQMQQQADEALLGANQGDGVVRYDTRFKHRLQNTWTLWYLENDRNKTWEEMQNEITSFDTVEDFWSLYNHIKPPSELKLGSDYSMFKKGIRPMWEDAANKFGGRWVITMKKNSNLDLDNYWLEVVLCLIGEAFESTEEICGAVVNVRNKNNKISVWTAHSNNEGAILEIGYKLREGLHLGRQTLQYRIHIDSMVKDGNTRATYTL